MTITWLGHACFLLESGGYRVILDPLKGVPGCADTAGEAEAVYCSHAHFDHCYTEKIHICEGKESPFNVYEIPCFHDEVQGAKRGKNTIRVLTADGVRVAHLGDLGHPLNAQLLAAIGACDVLLLPVGGTYTLDAQAAKQVADAIHPRVICPMHYRRGDMGFDVLQTVEEFTSLYDSEMIHWMDSNSMELTGEVLSRGGVVVFSPK